MTRSDRRRRADKSDLTIKTISGQVPWRTAYSVGGEFENAERLVTVTAKTACSDRPDARDRHQPGAGFVLPAPGVNT